MGEIWEFSRQIVVDIANEVQYYFTFMSMKKNKHFILRQKLVFGSLLFLLMVYFGKGEGAPFQDYLISIDSKETFSGIALVDAIYMLNLDRRPDRLDYMNTILKKYEIQAIRVSACDGRHIPESVIQELTGLYYKDNIFFRNKQRDYHAAIGCLLSHLSVLHDAYVRGFQIIWVLEDDIKVVGDITKVPDLLTKLFILDPEWDILYTDVPKKAMVVCPPNNCQLCSRKKRLQIEKQGDLFNLIRWRYGTYSMLISRKGIDKILKYFQSSDIYGPIDNDLHCIPGIREYSIQADIVTHAGLFPSDIDRKR